MSSLLPNTIFAARYRGHDVQFLLRSRRFAWQHSERTFASLSGVRAAIDDFESWNEDYVDNGWAVCDLCGAPCDPDDAAPFAADVRHVGCDQAAAEGASDVPWPRTPLRGSPQW